MFKFKSIVRNCAVVLLIMLSSLTNTAAVTLFSEDFSDNSAGWTLNLEWPIGPATASDPIATVTHFAYGSSWAPLR